MGEPGKIYYMQKSGNKYSIEDDINRLFEAIDGRTSSRVNGFSREIGIDALWKRAMKRPVRVGSSHALGIGISEPMSLKQALRGLSISQASEMAAMKKRLSKPAEVSEAGTIRRLYSAVVVEENGSGVPLNEGKGNLVEISFVPERTTSNSMEKISDSFQVSNVEVLNQNSSPSDNATMEKATTGFLAPGQIVPLGTQSKNEVSKAEHKKLNFIDSSAVNHAAEEATGIGCSSIPICVETPSTVKEPKGKLLADSPPPVLGLLVSPSTSYSDSQIQKPSGNGRKESMKISLVSSSTSCGIEVTSSMIKGEFSQSSKSSIGEYSSGTITSEESNIIDSSRIGSRPHMSKDLRWDVIRSIQKQHGSLSLKHFKLLKKLGCGDIGTVYLAEITNTNCLFALKVMNNEFLWSHKKIPRAQTEKEIMQMLDHPFLPTLYAYLATNQLSCLVMEYCPGGDLHVLRQKQPGRSFSEQAVRFYGAEVLLALEYLHMLGVVYRDLKPENILVREDGHIMLTDFDLSLRCDANPVLLKSASPVAEPAEKMSKIIKGEGHGNVVDWWTFGIFLFELLYGKTPFKGSGNDEILSNVVSHSLRFSSSPIVSFHARDLIRGLLVKEPENRLGSMKGAAEIRQHPFFEGLNWALIRCTIPPEMPRLCETSICMPTPALQKKDRSKDNESQDTEDHMEFDMF
ncbi:hypothetical protein V6N13_145205 [Hibiscus sabdariffa]